MQKTEWIWSQIKIKWDDSRHQATRAIPNIFSKQCAPSCCKHLPSQNRNLNAKIGHDLLFWIWWYLLTWPISILTCDNVSKTFWKICKAKFDALPDLVCNYTISSEYLYTKQINPYLLKVTIFIKYKIWKELKFKRH